MNDKPHICPLAANDAEVLSKLDPPFNGEAVWRHDGTCSYCGSLNPDTFMERLEAGTLRLGPTDKSYKVYLERLGGDNLGASKFYFQHLSQEQRTRFIELHNAQRIPYSAPGYLYVIPFFCREVERPKQDDGA